MNTSTDNEHLKEAREDEARWTRIVMNDLENIPLALIIFWGSSFVLLKSYDFYGILLLSFVLGRLSHTTCFRFGLQPWRSISYLVAILGVFINLLIVLYKIQTD